MLGQDRLQEIAARSLRRATADQTEVIVTSSNSLLTRFAANTIHQNVSETDVSVRIRSIVDRKTGVASGNRVEDDDLARLVQSAETAARFQQPNPEIQSLPKPRPIKAVNAFRESTASFTPMQRAEAVRSIIKQSRDHGLEAAGAFSNEQQEFLVANSLGVSAYHRGTVAHLVTVVMGDDSSGYASSASLDVSDIDAAAVGKVAVDKALQGRHPSDLEPGEYTVILEEEAVADMLFMLGYIGLGALAFQERRSFMTGKLGEKITGDNITIWDDGHDLRGLPMSFDFEGVPKEKVILVENGTARNVVYDTFTAAREQGRSSTGHSLPAPNGMGPIPIHLFMAPGTATKEEMLASTERGIWVTRFHYTNPVHPVQSVITGMTRDGTFLIENGKITRPLKNLRFTQSILEAFANAEMLGNDLKMVKDDWNSLATCAPAAKVRNFRFTGTTDF